MMLPLQQITHVITPVMHPVLTTLQNNYPQMARDYAKILKLLATIGFPLGVFLYFSATNLITIVYGDQWLPAVPVFKILPLSVPFQMLIATTGGIFQASGRTDWLFYAGGFHSCITIFGFLIAAFIFDSIKAMAWAFVITMNLQTILAIWIIYKLVLKQTLKPVSSYMLVPIVSGVVIALSLYALDIFVENHFIGLILQIIVTMFISCMIVQKSRQYNIVSFIQSVIHRPV